MHEIYLTVIGLILLVAFCAVMAAYQQAKENNEGRPKNAHHLPIGKRYRILYSREGRIVLLEPLKPTINDKAIFVEFPYLPPYGLEEGMIVEVSEHGREFVDLKEISLSEALT